MRTSGLSVLLPVLLFGVLVWPSVAAGEASLPRDPTRGAAIAARFPRHIGRRRSAIRALHLRGSATTPVGSQSEPQAGTGHERHERHAAGPRPRAARDRLERRRIAQGHRDSPGTGLARAHRRWAWRGLLLDRGVWPARPGPLGLVPGRAPPLRPHHLRRARRRIGDAVAPGWREAQRPGRRVGGFRESARVRNAGARTRRRFR